MEKINVKYNKFNPHFDESQFIAIAMFGGEPIVRHTYKTQKEIPESDKREYAIVPKGLANKLFNFTQEPRLR